MKRISWLISTLVIVFCFFSAARAQSEAGSASLEGTVSDQNGAAVSGAVIEIRNQETGLIRNAVANENGAFTANVLPVGTYLVKVKAQGFAETTQTVLLTVGETVSVNMVIFPQGAAVNVEVRDSRELIDQENVASSSTIIQRSVSDLPIRGRNYTEFVQLSPAVIQEGDRSGLVISGQRSINSNVSIDGADFNDSMQGNQRGGNEAVFFFPQTAIREFQVVRSGATAEVGRTNAGFVNAVTKSGTNQVRGEAFFFNRNSRLTSPDAFDNDGENDQNLFGGAIGGPIKKDKAFYFFGIEKNFLRIPYFVDFITPAGVQLPADLAALEGESISTNDPTSLFARLDYSFNQQNSFNLQYTYSRFSGDNFSVLDEGITLTDRANEIRRTGDSNGVKGSLVTVFNTKAVNELRVQVATDNRLEEANNVGPEIRIDGIGLPGSSNARFGGNSSRPRIFRTTRYQFSNNFSYDIGSHTLKFGVDFNINRFEGRRIPDGVGTWRFIGSGSVSALTNYINRIPRRLQQTVLLIPDLAVAKGYQREYAFFVNDKWKISKTIKLTAGLRLEMLDNPNPPAPNPSFVETQKIPDDFSQWQPRLGISWDVSGNGKTVLKISSGIYAARTPSVLFIRPFVENGVVSKFVRVDERSGGSCRTSPSATNCVLRRNPDNSTGSNFIVAYPDLLTPAQATTLADPLRQRIFGFDPDFKNPRSFQASVTLDQALGEEFVLSLGFIRSSTWNLQRRFNRNLRPPIPESDPSYPAAFIGTGYPVFAPFPAGRFNPAIDWFSVNESTAHSDYNGLTISLNRRFSERYFISANYTLSETRDDDSNERNFDREPTLNPYNLKAEAGPSKQDVRHNFNFSGVIDLGNGFTLSGILITRSGFPYTAVLGDDFNGDNNSDNDRAIVNGKVTGRNAFRQPNFFNLDLRLIKSFRFSERYSLAFSAEVFNATRAKNKTYGPDAISAFCTSVPEFQGPNPSGFNITCPSGTAPSIFAGEPFTAPSTARFGGPRQLQLGVKFSF